MTTAFDGNSTTSRCNINGKPENPSNCCCCCWCCSHHGLFAKRIVLIFSTLGMVVLLTAGYSPARNSFFSTTTLTVLHQSQLTVIKENKQHHQHAACWSDSLFILSRQQASSSPSSPQWFFNVLSAGHYVPSTRPTNKPRYDHLSCFVMKSRYNCAKVPTQQSPDDDKYSNHTARSIENANSTEAVASDYKLVLWPKNPNHNSSTTGDNNMDGDDSVCDLPAFIEDLGGPGGVASLILKQKNDDSSSTSSSNNKRTSSVFSSSSVTTTSSSHHSHSSSSNNKSKKMLTVALHGNSYLRQIWESLACTWKDQITDLLLYYQDEYLPNNSSLPNSSRIISFEKIKKKKNETEKGAFLGGLSPMTEGCHVFFPRPAMKEWFHPPVVTTLSLPPTIPGCSDDLAMVEFNQKIRFYFIMRPDEYQNLTHVYDELNLEPSDIDALVFNNVKNYSSDFYPDDLKRKLRPGVFENSTMSLEVTHYERLQKRDLKRWFGADNPGIHKPPDVHPCMPGVPEDEANVLLYELLLRLLKNNHLPTQ